MKRARPSPPNPDPVYPIGNVSTSCQPIIPFLMIRTGDPLFTSDGTVYLKYGSGLGIDNDGRLEATGGGGTTFTVERPLDLTNDVLSLLFGQGLKIEGGKLETAQPMLTASSPLTLSPTGALSLGIGNTLKVEAGNLETTLGPMTFSAPLSKTGDAVSLLIGTGLSVVSGALTATAAPTLTATAPLDITGDDISLRLDPNSALKSKSDQLTIELDYTLQTNGSNMGIKPPVVPLALSRQGNLDLVTDTDLTIVDGKLTLSAPGAPLSKDRLGHLVLNTGAGLTLDSSNKLAVIGAEKVFTYISPAPNSMTWSFVYKTVPLNDTLSFYQITVGQVWVNKTGGKTTFTIPLFGDFLDFIKKCPVPLTFTTTTGSTPLSADTRTSGYMTIDSSTQSQLQVVVNNAVNVLASFVVGGPNPN